MCVKFIYMNFGSKKTILKALLYWQIIIACFSIPFHFLSLIYFSEISKVFESLYGITLNLNVFYIIYFCLYIIYFSFFINYIIYKHKQTRDQFHNKKIFFRFFSIISLFFDLITGILLIIAAFRRDDGKEEIVYINPNKKNKPEHRLSKHAKKEIKSLKHQQRLGNISNEKYEKQFKEILKKEK